TLSGSEFFGHERGAFTGAVATREGAFALADRGVLFLDEVGELPLPLQSELLRVVQEGTYKRVGGNDWRRTSFRLVCATNRDLEWRGDGFVRAIRRAVAHGVTLREIGTAATDAAIAIALGEEDGNLQRAARRLGLTPRALQLRRAAGRLPSPSNGDAPANAD